MEAGVGETGGKRRANAMIKATTRMPVLHSAMESHAFF
jgi:hypothetical protein